MPKRKKRNVKNPNFSESEFSSILCQSLEHFLEQYEDGRFVQPDCDAMVSEVFNDDETIRHFAIYLVQQLSRVLFHPDKILMEGKPLAQSKKH